MQREEWVLDTKMLRKDIFLAAYAGGIGHLASAYSCVEIIYSLYCCGAMHHDPHNPSWSGRDRFILSKGHGSLALYAVLCKAGYLDREMLMRFIKPDSLLGGEPSLCLPLGIEASTGSLGHGLSIGVGMALACKNDRLNNRVFVLLGDGECEEGSVWEAVMSAVKYGLDNLIIILDHNRIQKMDTVASIAGITDWTQRFTAFGCACTEVDGHDVGALTDTLSHLPREGKTNIVLANTVKGKGVSIMENDPAWHWRMPNRKERKVFMQELTLSEEELSACR